MGTSIIFHFLMLTLSMYGLFFFKSKSETDNALLQFIANAEKKKKNYQVNFIHIDGGSDIPPLKEYFQKRGIT